MNKLNGYLAIAKTYINNGVAWIKKNYDLKVIGIAAAIGLITFSAWASFLLVCVCAILMKLLEKPKFKALLSLINIDTFRYIINAMIGFGTASLIYIIF